MSLFNVKKESIFAEVKTIFYALLIALVVRTFLFEPFSIPSGSMIPHLLIGDYLFVSKYTYGYSKHSFPRSVPLFSGRIFYDAPKQGDIAVFKVKNDGNKDYIKRVIGMPGDKVKLRKGRLYINGKIVKRERIEEFIQRDEMGVATRFAQYVETLPNGVSHRIIEISDDGIFDNTVEFEVPDSHFFMMGDNRDNSADSRTEVVGFVPAEVLVGKARFLFFSQNGTSSWWEFWRWPAVIRWGRIFNSLAPESAKPVAGKSVLPKDADMNMKES